MRKKDVIWGNIGKLNVQALELSKFEISQSDHSISFRCSSGSLGTHYLFFIDFRKILRRFSARSEIYCCATTPFAHNV